MHIKQIHQKRLIKCTLCEKNINHSYLKYHIARIHQVATNGETWEKCDICDRNFLGKLALQNHKRIHFKKPKQWACPYESCTIKTDCQERLVAHVNGVHFKLRPFQCKFCSSSFKPKAHMEAHVNAFHTENRVHKYQCDNCEYKTSDSRNFKNHVNAVHLKIRPYKCDACNQTFTQKPHLNTHKKTVHLHTKPFSCKHCLSKFSARPHLELHEKAVHNEGEPEFKCEICGFESHYRDSIKKHIANVHQKESKFKSSMKTEKIQNKTNA